MDHNEDLPHQGEEESSVAVKRLFMQLTQALETLAPGLFTSPAQLHTCIYTWSPNGRDREGRAWG